MSYYVTNKGNIYEAAAGFGAFVRPVPIAPRDVTYLPISGMGAAGYQALKDRPFMYRAIKDAKVRRFRALRGMGETALEYNGAAVWSDQVACASAWQTSQTTISRCNWVNKTRAALAALGYGVLHQGVQWDAEDQAAVKAYAAKNGLVSNAGLPTKDIHMLIEAHLSAPSGPVVTGDKEPVEMTKEAGSEVYTVVKKTVADTAAKTGLSTAQLALIGVGLVGIAAVAIAVKRRGARKTPAGAAIQAPLPGAVPVGAKA